MSDFKQISPIFLFGMIVLFIIPWAISYVFFFKDISSDFWYQVIMSGIVGGFLFPSFLLLVGGLLIVLVLTAEEVLYDLYLNAKKIFVPLSDITKFDLEMYLVDELGGKKAVLPIGQDVTKKLYNLGQLSFSKEIYFKGEVLIWFTYGDVSQVRIFSSDHKLPSLIIDSSANNSNSQLLSSERLHMDALDFGNDFSDYYKVYALPEARAPVYEVLTPAKMIDLITILSEVDLLINKNHFDFVMHTPISKQEFHERIQAVFAIKRSINNSSKDSHLPLRTAIAIKKSAPSIENIIDLFVSVIVLAGATTVLAGIVLSLGGSLAEAFSFETAPAYNFINYLLLTPVVLALISATLMVPLLTNSLIFMLTSNFVISTSIRLQQFHYRRKFAYIAKKYSY